MTEPSEAAKHKACELANEAEGEVAYWKPKDVVQGGTLNALARVLQEHSDVAKEFLDSADKNGLSAAFCSRLPALQSLILPEEPCGHQLDLCAPALGPGRCIKCGKRLKLTEVGDD